MPCESYKEALTDAVAAGEAPSRELTAHLAACAACRAFFAEEQQLFAVLDSGVHAAANSDVPASLFSRVRAHLDDQKSPNVSWMGVGALLVSAALVLMSVLVLPKMRSTSREPIAPEHTAAVGPAPKESATAVVSGVGPKKQSIEPLSTKENHRGVARARGPAADSVVLVPTGQKEAVDNLLAALSKGTVKADDLLVKGAASVSTIGELVPLGIPEIEIKPLAAVSEDSAPTR